MGLQLEHCAPSDPTVTTLRMEITSPSWEQWFLLRSDAHHDNTHCQHALEKKHLDQAKERGAGILDFGDLFCAMQGKWDKRADFTQFRPELRVANYLDALVQYNADFYAPYAEHFLMLSRGNHEGSIIERHQTDLTLRLVERLRAGGSTVQCGKYAGWVRFMFQFHSTKRKTVRLRYTHGYGGGGPVTRDLIQAHRQLAFLGNVDMLVSGHTHDAWHVTAVQEFLDHNGRPQLSNVECIKCGGYKDEYSGGSGWAVAKESHPSLWEPTGFGSFLIPCMEKLPWFTRSSARIDDSWEMELSPEQRQIKEQVGTAFARLKQSHHDLMGCLFGDPNEDMYGWRIEKALPHLVKTFADYGELIRSVAVHKAPPPPPPQPETPLEIALRERDEARANATRFAAERDRLLAARPKPEHLGSIEWGKWKPTPVAWYGDPNESFRPDNKK